MLQKEFKTLIAEIFQQACPTVTVRFGTSNAVPTDTDGGLKGGQLATVALPSVQDGVRFAVRTVAPILIPSGVAAEVFLENSDGVAIDRLLITPITGGPDGLIELEYSLEAL